MNADDGRFGESGDFLRPHPPLAVDRDANDAFPILAVVDYFDALMTERPYHKAMSQEAAQELIKRESGRGLDPSVVAKFVELLPGLSEETASLDAQTVRRLSLEHGPVDDSSRPATGLSPESFKQNVFDDIALAHREIYALYEIAQAMGTSLGVAETTTIIAGKLTNLVPYHACALFIYDKEQDVLRCHFATGIDADLIQQLAIKNGEGATMLPLRWYEYGCTRVTAG